MEFKSQIDISFSSLSLISSYSCIEKDVKLIDWSFEHLESLRRIVESQGEGYFEEMTIQELGNLAILALKAPHKELQNTCKTVIENYRKWLTTNYPELIPNQHSNL
tara:strand:- start:333 stop:650 length:318 start_codon:yes stop_codon:yes gene_type:complete